MRLDERDGRGMAGRTARRSTSVGMGAALVVLALCAPTPADAGDPELAACARIPQPQARLACYDALARSRSAATAAHGRPSGDRDGRGEARGPEGGTSQAAGRQASTAPAKRVAEDGKGDDFGLPPRPREGREDVSRAFVIARVRRNPYGELIFEMKNGQVWKQIVAGGLPPIRPGTGVRIRRGKLGGFLMKVKGRTVRVKRVR